MGRRGLRLVRNLWFDEGRQERQRLLPPQVAGFDWNHRRQPLLYDFELGSAGDPAQRDRDLHLARHVRVVELVGVSDSLVWGQLDVRSAEGMAPTGAEVRERHPVAASDACVRFMDLAGEA